MVYLLPLLSFSTLAAFAGIASGEIHPTLRASMDRELHRKLELDLIYTPRANIFVVMKESPKESREAAAAGTYASRTKRIEAIRSALRNHAAQSQKKVWDLLETRADKYMNFTKSLWITNEVYVRGAEYSLITELHELENVAEIYEEDMFGRLVPRRLGEEDNAEEKEEEEEEVIRYGAIAVGAPEAWRKGYRGQGIRIGGIDAGINAVHVAMNDTFLGRHGKKSYGYYDPFGTDYDAHNPFAKKPLVPAKISKWTTKYGMEVAPEAEWLSCAGCAWVGCHQFSLKACGQFMLCPHDAKNEDEADCSLTPHVVTSTYETGKPGDTRYAPIIDAWRDAGIIPVYSVGSNGEQGCGAVASPADNPKVLGVGMITESNERAPFSSKGPSINDPTAIKPNVVAPGYNTDKSSGSTVQSAYTTTGVVALILSKNPKASFDQVVHALTATANTDILVPEEDTCGMKKPGFPNFSYGYGAVDAARSVN